MKLSTRLRVGLLVLLAVPTIQPAHAQTDVTPPDGTWTHRATGTPFPPMVGVFERGSITEYDDSGDDASVGYGFRNDVGGLVSTVYIYPAEPGNVCTDYYVGAKQAIEQYPGATLIDEGTASPPDGAGGPSALTARYHIPAGAMREDIPAIVSDLYLYCTPDNRWLVKYRASWSGTDANFPDMTLLLRAISWPTALRGK